MPPHQATSVPPSALNPQPRPADAFLATVDSFFPGTASCGCHGVTLIMHLAILAVSLCLAGLAVDAGSWPLPQISPARAGFSSERLGRLDAYCEDLVATGRYSGLTVLLARDGRIVHWASHGFRDRASGTPMARDDVFAIASLTKIVTTVSALILVEEGRLTLREPIGRHLPEFNAMQVLAGGTAAAPVLTDAIRPITLHHLLTHTAGFSSFDAATSPIFAEMRRLRPTEVSNLQDMARSLATFPLQSQPGEAWVYGPSTDLVGALVEKVSGQPFERFVEERILRPLGMRDTSFEVPPSKRSRQVAFDIRQPDGSLRSNPPKPRGQAWPSGGGGLYSTVADYVRFAQMLLNGGELFERFNNLVYQALIRPSRR